MSSIRTRSRSTASEEGGSGSSKRSRTESEANLSTILRQQTATEVHGRCRRKHTTNANDVARYAVKELHALEKKMPNLSFDILAESINICNLVKKMFEADQQSDNIPIGSFTQHVQKHLKGRLDSKVESLQSKQGLDYKEICEVRLYQLTFSNVVYMEAIKDAQLNDCLRDNDLQIINYKDKIVGIWKQSELDIRDTMFNEIHNREFKKKIAWHLAVQCLDQFQYRLGLRPLLSIAEIVYHSELWNPLLSICIGTRFEPFQSVMEFHLCSKTLSSYPDGYDHYIDVACFLNIDGKGITLFPILFAEVAAHRLKSEQFHKDFHKMIIDMVAALLAQIGILRNAGIKSLKRLKMFGLFLSAGQYHPCILVPVFEDDNDIYKVSFVLYMQREWSGDLLDSSPKDSRSSVTLEIPALKDCSTLEDIWEQVDAAVEGITTNHDIGAFSEQDAIKSLQTFFEFCQHVRQYGRQLQKDVNDWKGDNPQFFKDPLSYPGSYSDPVPSRAAHSSYNTPAQPPRSRKRSDRDPKSTGITQSVLANGEVVIEKRKQKLASADHEGVMLSAAQGPGIVKLHSYRISGADEIIIVEEALDDPLQWEHLSERALLVLAIRLVLDGIDALRTLRQSGIVHCDISPNNFMYSVSAQKWKLTDFDCARYCTADGSVQTDFVYGTDGYIAPEVLRSRTYSSASDAYSFGQTALYYLSRFREHAYRHSFSANVDITIDILDSLIRISFMSDSPDERRPVYKVNGPVAMHEEAQIGLDKEDSGLIRIRTDDTAAKTHAPDPNSEQQQAASDLGDVASHSRIEIVH